MFLILQLAQGLVECDICIENVGDIFLYYNFLSCYSFKSILPIKVLTIGSLSKNIFKSLFFRISISTLCHSLKVKIFVRSKALNIAESLLPINRLNVDGFESSIRIPVFTGAV